MLVLQTCLFPFEQEKNGKLSFLDTEVSQEKGKFVTTVFRKPTFSGVYTHFESSLPTIYKFGMVYTLAYCCFKICSDWTKFHEELSFLKHFFKKNGYPLSFIVIYLSLPYLGEISLQTRTKLRKSLKAVMDSCKLQIAFKSQRKLSNVFHFKDCLLFDLVSGVVYSYICMVDAILTITVR